ncbi:MAG: enoyl-CoA hydratase/isomerase family protein [Dehalococcoidia bacterium]
MAVNVERVGRITVITLDRPEKMNAFDRAQYAAVNEAVADYQADDAARVAIITSSVEKAFSVGVDLQDLRQAMAEERLGGDEIAKAFSLTIAGEEALTKPIIAAIPGYCVGEALGLALYCDLRVAADNAQFSLPEAKVGITTVRGTIRLPQIVGLGNALELLFTGARKDAAWAERSGLVNAVVPFSQLMDKAMELAGQIADASPMAIQNMKKLAIKSFSIPFEEAIAMGMEMRRNTPRAQLAEGASAFLEKRKPDFG